MHADLDIVLTVSYHVYIDMLGKFIHVPQKSGISD